MRLAAIINPIAGANKQRAKLNGLLGCLRREGIIVDVYHSTAAGHARELALAAAGRVDAIMAVGGDGTVREVATGVIGSQVPLLIWPTGTENLVAHSLGFKADPTLIHMTLAAGRVMQMDVGMANGHCFLVVVGVGFDAEVVHRLDRLRTGHITHLSYFSPLLRTFCEHRFPLIRVIANSQPYWEGRGMVFVGNLARYALGLPVVRDARADDGQLDLCIMPCHNKLQLIGHSLRTLCARHIEHPSVHYTHVQHVRIESAFRAASANERFDVPVELDGDVGGHLPIDIDIRPAAIRVLIPQS